MLVSAQAEPVVRPYYEGKPQLVNGMLAGVALWCLTSAFHGLARILDQLDEFSLFDLDDELLDHGYYE